MEWGQLVLRQDLDTSYGAAYGLYLDGDSGYGISESYRLPQGCANGQISEWNSTNSLWECAADDSGSTGFYGGGKTAATGTQYSNTFYVGSLPYHGNGTFEKMLVYVWGGTWYNNSMGQDHYAISSRGGLRITRSRFYGATARHEIKVYSNNNENRYDIVILIILISVQLNWQKNIISL